ncbi:MAG TPA: NAD(P)/FAD-dependent oxidoreductase [Solirubrobacteraceae bacterium]|jgi:flavin-dependent dehydrogenase|nr:NAD(P)/FAD-dependent oxidoreductase [Solirubrobacteraceae bacterium]
MADTPERYDVAITGGGLAGLTLALHLARTRPSMSIVLAERRAGLRRGAAFKVGESSMETAGRYFTKVVGMEEHLESVHRRKAGLRFFFPVDENVDFGRRVERGPPGAGPIPSYQIDRGVFENELARSCVEHGVELLDGCRVLDVRLQGDGHEVVLNHGSRERTITARWVLDASGRSSLLKRKLGLARPVEHTINSAWLRLEDGLDLEDFVTDERWFERMEERGIRRASTNHLMGEGYWVWIILLGTGPVSIGICADPRYHPFDSFNTLDRAIEWFERHEPHVGRAIASRREQVMDFLKVQDFAFGAERVYSPKRWCLAGEAGVFADPLYSPGSDSISLSNTFIVDLVTRDLDGEDIGERLERYNSTYLAWFEGLVLPTYTNQYGLFGNAEVMAGKLAWDDAVRWTILALWMYREKWTDLEFLDATAEPFQSAIRLNHRLQQLFRDWHETDRREWRDIFLSPREVPCLGIRLIGLMVEIDDETLMNNIRLNQEFLEALTVILFHRATDARGDRVDPESRINPYAVGLDRSRWDQDGLFDDGGLTLAEALERSPGIENAFPDRYAPDQAG